MRRQSPGIYRGGTTSTFEIVDLSMIARVRRWLHFPGIEPERELIGQPERSLRRFSIYSSFWRQGAPRARSSIYPAVFPTHCSAISARKRCKTLLYLSLSIPRLSKLTKRSGAAITPYGKFSNRTFPPSLSPPSPFFHAESDGQKN